MTGASNNPDTLEVAVGTEIHHGHVRSQSRGDRYRLLDPGQFPGDFQIVLPGQEGGQRAP